MNTNWKYQGKWKTSAEYNKRDVQKFINKIESISLKTKDETHIVLSSQIKNNKQKKVWISYALVTRNLLRSAEQKQVKLFQLYNKIHEL